MENWIAVENTDRQIEGFVHVECIAEIRYNETGEVREYETIELLDIDCKQPSVFNWEENNYSCDCNRHLFFKRAKNEETEEDWDITCTDGKYSVNLRNKKNGEVYYREFND